MPGIPPTLSTSNVGAYDLAEVFGVMWRSEKAKTQLSAVNVF